MDWWGRLWGAKKQLSVAALAPFLSGDRLWIAVGAVVLLGVALIIAVCWLAHRTKDEKNVEIETPILSVRRGSSKRPKGAREGRREDLSPGVGQVAGRHDARIPRSAAYRSPICPLWRRRVTVPLRFRPRFRVIARSRARRPRPGRGRTGRSW
jgi:hypothetical protein